jgi:hypothetical protein
MAFMGAPSSININVVSCMDYPDAVLLGFYGRFIAYTWTTCRNVIGHNLITCLMDDWGTHPGLSTHMSEILSEVCLLQDFWNGTYYQIQKVREYFYGQLQNKTKGQGKSIALVSMNCLGMELWARNYVWNHIYINVKRLDWVPNMSKYPLFLLLSPTLLFLLCLYNGHLLYHKTNTNFLNLKMWIND